MSACVYCLYSTEDGVPRYVSLASDKVSYRFKQHIASALEKEPGALYDWMRDAWRRDFDVGVYTLQEGIGVKDRTMFEQYWVHQFADLLNATGNNPGGQVSITGLQVISAIREQLDRARKGAE